MYVAPVKPVGVNPALEQDRIPVLKVYNGDTWTIDADVTDPVTRRPGTPETVNLKFSLTENRFVDDMLWNGTWFDGVVPDDVVEGLVHIKIPRDISSKLRRGIYAFSMKVSDKLDTIAETQLVGHIQVEYEPTSDTHNIPYRSKSAE